LKGRFDWVSKKAPVKKEGKGYSSKMTGNVEGRKGGGQCLRAPEMKRQSEVSAKEDVLYGILPA